MPDPCVSAQQGESAGVRHIAAMCCADVAGKRDCVTAAAIFGAEKPVGGMLCVDVALGASDDVA